MHVSTSTRGSPQLQPCRCLTTFFLRTLQTEHLDLSVISSLVNATLHTLDDTVLPSANWVLELLDECEHPGIKVMLADITTFQEQAAKPFTAHPKENISSCFTSSSDTVSALSIFDPRKAPEVDSSDLPQYGEQAIISHCYDVLSKILLH